VFRSDDQDGVGAGEFALEAHHLRRQVAFEVLVEHRQIVDAREIRFEAAGAELGERMGELAVDRIAAVAADDDGEIGLGHGADPLVKIDNRR
jgi:hypothetical protein